MSVARVHTVQKARKDQGRCERCLIELPAGGPYRYFTVGFRSKWAHKRCLRSECTPRRSELESSKMSGVYSAIETAQDELAALRDAEPGEQRQVTDIIESMASSIREVADEYREADEQIGGGGTGSTVSGERADELEEALYGVESFSPSADPDDFTECDNADGEEHDPDTCEECSDSKRELWNELLDEAESAIEEMGL